METFETKFGAWTARDHVRPRHILKDGLGGLKRVSSMREATNEDPMPEPVKLVFFKICWPFDMLPEAILLSYSKILRVHAEFEIFLKL